MSEPFLGQVILFGGNFAPRGWAFCDGSLLSIAQYTALFSLLGTTYGGDGQVTFALPDLRGRVPIHFSSSNAPGLSFHPEGEVAGNETVTVVTAQLPTHIHLVAIAASNEGNNSPRPVGSIFGTGAIYETPAGASGNLGGVVAGGAGGNAPHNNMQPYQAINYVIALEGIYPARN